MPENPLIRWISHIAAEVQHGSSAMGGYCLNPQFQNRAFALPCLCVMCVAVLRIVFALGAGADLRGGFSKPSGFVGI